mgnify:CR=1 FL=1
MEKGNKKNSINIVLTGDANYSKVMGVTIVSVLENLNKNCFANFYLYTEGFTNEDISEIKKIESIYNCEIIIIDVGEYIKIFDFVDQKDFKNSYISKSCLYRLLMFKYLPENVEKCFYIDSDIIVDGDLSILNLPDNKMFAAVPEGYAMQHREKILEHWYRLPEYSNFVKDPIKYTHFGAGFFLADIKKAKQFNVFAQIVELLKKYPAMPYADQDILNAIFGQKYQEYMFYLPPEYNVFSDQNYNMVYDRLPYSNEIFQNACLNPVVIHFAGINKPWVNNHCNRFWNKWWIYCNKSPWKFYYAPKYISIICGGEFKKIIQNIFSVRNEFSQNVKRKVITIAGVKFKIKSQA